MISRGNSRLRNPYTNRMAIVSEDFFFGRDRELERLYSRLLGEQSVSLVGERRIGKSSLLRALDFDVNRIDFDVPDEMLFVFLDMQSVAECSEEKVLEYFLDELGTTVGIERLPTKRESLSAIGRLVAGRGQRLVLVIDEFDILLHNESVPLGFFSYLRSWASRFRVCFAVASKEGAIEPILETSRTGSPFLNIFGTLYVGPLERSEAELLVREPADLLDQPFSDEEAGWVFRLGGCHPLFLNIASCHLFEAKQAGVDEDRLLRTAEREFRTEALPHLHYLFDRLTDREIEVFRAVVDRRSVDDNSALYELVRKGILIEWDGELRAFSKTFARLLMSTTDEASSPEDLIREFEQLL